MRIFSSAAWCFRVARRMLRTSVSDDAGVELDCRFDPCGCRTLRGLRRFSGFTNRLAIARARSRWAFWGSRFFQTTSKGSGTASVEYFSPYGQPHIGGQRRVIDEDQKELERLQSDWGTRSPEFVLLGPFSC